MQISPPRSGITAFQVGAIIGVVSGLLVGGVWWIPSGLLILIFDFLVPIVALLLAGLLAARRTGRVSTGTLAGLWAGFIGTVIAFTVIAIALETVQHAAFISGLMSNPSVNPQNAEQTAWLGLAIIGVILVIAAIGLGAGLGALGGLIGKTASPLAQRPYPPSPVYLQTPYPAPPPYQPSPYAPQQPPPYQPSPYPPPQQPPPSPYEQ
jgi:hypothetical protein